MRIIICKLIPLSPTSLSATTTATTFWQKIVVDVVVVVGLHYNYDYYYNYNQIVVVVVLVGAGARKARPQHL